MGQYNNYGEFDGLEGVGEVYLQEPNWDFYILGVWKNSEGEYFIGTDSGCSCPSPWEYYEKSDLTGPLTAEQVREEAKSLWEGYDPKDFNELLDSL